MHWQNFAIDRLKEEKETVLERRYSEIAADTVKFHGQHCIGAAKRHEKIRKRTQKAARSAFDDFFEGKNDNINETARKSYPNDVDC